MFGVKPKVSKLLRRHLNGESDSREDVKAPIMRDSVPEWERRILCTVKRPCTAQISEKKKCKAHVTQPSLSAGGLQARGRLLGSPSPRFCRVPDPVKSKPYREGDSSIV
jgi:hypothetical protein